jgi:Uma2 family endonuclease
MSIDKPRPLVRLEYAKAAEAYLRSLRPEHFMEATAQARQREITVESLALVHAQRPEIQYFNELLVQYPHGRGQKIRQVVPDNMVVIHNQPIQAEGSYDLPLQPVAPFWVLEYVSKHSERKDYEDSFRKYERELKVPYYLLFYPDNQDLTLFRFRGTKYRSVTANAAGRHPIRELELELGLLDGWVRYWYKGRLLPLPADLQRVIGLLETQLDQERAEKERERAEKEHERAEKERERAEKERLLARLRQLGIDSP